MAFCIDIPEQSGIQLWRRLLICLILFSILIHFAVYFAGYRSPLGTDSDGRLLLHSKAGLEQHRATEEYIKTPTISPESKDTSTLEALIDVLDVMQKHHFELWEGLWPTSIDWTAAVMATHISAALGTLSSSADYILRSSPVHSANVPKSEELINRYFSHLISFYFGQDAVAIRSEAYDDMLWVVLEYLEAIKFINLHSSRHYRVQSSLGGELTSPFWYGEEWIPGFAHRAQIFWSLASKGWNTSLCGGGMIWSPHLLPYKNAITNELFITASISMYLYFPGDDNPSPFVVEGGIKAPRPPIGPQDPMYLAAAIEGYKWLASSSMRNEKGLYIDGFHINDYDKRRDEGEEHLKCDVRNEMVYTYNQGVLLSGQRGLWEATGSRSYLEDGHALISSVINATGFDLKYQRVYDESWPSNRGGMLGTWYGVGRAGILEEACDAYGTCSQDSQTFKGIFFHHLALFCAPLPPYVIRPGETVDTSALEEMKVWHLDSCGDYGKWIERNAKAAMATINGDGEAGMWWGAPLWSNSDVQGKENGEIPKGAVDYRNRGVPDDIVWRDQEESSQNVEDEWVLKSGKQRQQRVYKIRGKPDANDRGRGRTVETQGGAVAVLRALWETVELRVLREEL